MREEKAGKQGITHTYTVVLVAREGGKKRCSTKSKASDANSSPDPRVKVCVHREWEEALDDG